MQNPKKILHDKINEVIEKPLQRIAGLSKKSQILFIFNFKFKK